MKPISYARHRFPTDVIRQAVWLYFRFTLSFRDIEDLMAERGIDVSDETIQCWTWKFGRMFAHNLRESRTAPTSRWHLDEIVVRIGGQRMFLCVTSMMKAKFSTCLCRSAEHASSIEIAQETSEAPGHPSSVFRFGPTCPLAKCVASFDCTIKICFATLCSNIGCNGTPTTAQPTQARQLKKWISFHLPNSIQAPPSVARFDGLSVFSW